MGTYKCFKCDYVTADVYKICLQEDGMTELCESHCESCG